MSTMAYLVYFVGMFSLLEISVIDLLIYNEL